MFLRPLIIFAILLILEIVKVQTDPKVQFNSMHCDAVDGDFVEFEKCELKVISRNRRAGIVIARIKRDTNKCLIHARIMQKFSGWRPFLYDIKVEACDFFRNPKKYPIFNTAYQYGKHVTNAQHKCPYKENEYIRVYMPELEVTQLSEMLRKLPIDIGQYGIFVKFFVDGLLKATINTTSTYTDYRKG